MISFVTSNEHKFNEAKEIFKKYGIKLEWLAQDYKEIQGDSLEEIVVESLKEIGGTSIMIEDAGLFIDALYGFPGVYSRFVEDTIGNKGILKLMESIEDREARFESVVGYKDEEGEMRVFKGVVKGRIAHEIKGKGGFGYDPIFIPEGYNKTFAQDIKVKNDISHRKRALEEVARFLRNR
ncbi:MAG: XTP/dITP diphosphatase [Candidatus Hydrothermarchaeales archaeon]